MLFSTIPLSMADDLEDFFRKKITTEVEEHIKDVQILNDIVEIRFKREFENWKELIHKTDSKKEIISPNEIKTGDTILIEVNYWYSK